MRVMLSFVALLAWARPALACPSCAAGVAARDLVFGPELFGNALVALLPFALIGLLCLHLERRAGVTS